MYTWLVPHLYKINGMWNKWETTTCCVIIQKNAVLIDFAAEAWNPICLLAVEELITDMSLIILEPLQKHFGHIGSLEFCFIECAVIPWNFVTVGSETSEINWDDFSWEKSSCKCSVDIGWVVWDNLLWHTHTHTHTHTPPQKKVCVCVCVCVYIYIYTVFFDR